ncbi:hypothetical protein RND71_024301 [Anisodus tanguticus]|uniref:Bulb-type lectin domain-containing protein n=1 Tax=Anisodus tanguticus TaxID=243964 RepID=A0AAE1VCD8_9SOLA|nr:hypothetical protein RND71_024301 [Anisodus tanguticus]
MKNIDVKCKLAKVWSANRNNPVKTNATLQLGRDGNLVLADSDGTLVWSTNTAGRSVSGLNLTEMGNLVLFDKRKRKIWQSFDHPTDSLLPGQNLVSGQKLIASVSASNWSQGLLSFTILNGSLMAYIDTNPPQYYYASHYMNDTHLSFDGHTLSLVYFADQFLKLEHNGHLQVYKFDRNELDWRVESDVWVSESNIGNCGYSMVCGRYSICISDGQCNCPYEGNFFRPSIGRKADLGCTELTSISCYLCSTIELRDTAYFAFDINFQLNSSIWYEGTKLDDCKTACLSNCSCKAVVWAVTRRKNCLLLNEVFSIMDNGEGRDRTTVFLKVLEGLVIIETNLNYNFTNLPEVGADNQQREATISSKFPSVLSGPR